MKGWFFTITVCGAVLAVSGVVIYHFLVYIPNRDKQSAILEKNKIEEIVNKQTKEIPREEKIKNCEDEARNNANMLMAKRATASGAPVEYLNQYKQGFHLRADYQYYYESCLYRVGVSDKLPSTNYDK